MVAPLRNAGGGGTLPQYASGGGTLSPHTIERWRCPAAVGESSLRRVIEGTGGSKPPQPSGTAPVARVLHQLVVQHQQQIFTLRRDTAAAINREEPQMYGDGNGDRYPRIPISNNNY